MNQFVHMWTNCMQPRVDQCRMENQQPDARAKPLILYDMASPFIVLGLGICLSTLSFLIEIIYDRIENRY